MYCIQPIQTGKLPEFLKNPENKTTGNNITVTIDDNDLPSVIILPRSKPNEFPHKPTKKVIR